ncbi:MAG: hypothetical protein ACFFG0_29205 [Candidatus Thorarchaeota archaeon]
MVEEGLKIIISLCKFKGYGDLSDLYEIKSHPINDLAESEKNLFRLILKAEIT